jgi:hypothetical protein
MLAARISDQLELSPNRAYSSHISQGCPADMANPDSSTFQEGPECAPAEDGQGTNRAAEAPLSCSGGICNTEEGFLSRSRNSGFPGTNTVQVRHQTTEVVMSFIGNWNVKSDLAARWSSSLVHFPLAMPRTHVALVSRMPWCL